MSSSETGPASTQVPMEGSLHNGVVKEVDHKSGVDHKSDVNHKGGDDLSKELRDVRTWGFASTAFAV